MARTNARRLFLATAALVLSVTGCSLGIGDGQAQKFPANFDVFMRPVDSGQGELIDGRWTAATQVRIGSVDAERLGLPERISMNTQEIGPRMSILLETVWLIDDVGTSDEFCFEEALLLVDPTQGSEHTIAAAGDCSDRDFVFRFSADVQLGE